MSDMYRSALEVLSHPGLLTGIAVGVLGLMVLFGVAVLLQRPMFGWALVSAVAVATGLSLRLGGVPDLFLRLGIVTGAGFLADIVFSRHRNRGISGMEIGAALLAMGSVVWFTTGIEAEGSGWVGPVLPMVVITLGAGMWVMGRLSVADVLGPMFGVAVAGVWVTVPETDLFTVMLGVAAPLALATLRPICGRSSVAGALTLSALFSWLVLDGGMARVWTVAAGWAMVATLPMAAAVALMRSHPPGRWRIFVAHLVYVAVITRVADHTESAVVVLVWSVAFISGTALVLWLLSSDPTSEQALT